MLVRQQPRFLGDAAETDRWDVLPQGVGQTVRTLLHRPELRSMPMRELASRLSSSPLQVRDAIAYFVCDLRRRAGAPCSFESIVSRISADDSVDDVMSRLASNAAGPTYTARPQNQIYIPRASVLAEALRHNPHARRSPIVRRWTYLHRTGVIARPSEAAALDALTGAPGPAGVATPTSYTWHWRVELGDNASRITKLITGAEGRYPELIAANPSKATVGSAGSPYSTGYNFKTLTVGELLKIPNSWNQYIQADGSGYTAGKALPPMISAPPVVPPKPSGGDGEYTSTLSAGTITAIKLELGTWGKKEGTNPSYPGLFDVNDVIDESFLNAVRLFQKWSNSKKGTSLRTDGKLDAATKAAIDAYAVGSVTAPPAPGTTPPKPLPSLPGSGGGGTPIALPGGAPGGATKTSGSGSALPILILGALAASIA